jgi:hypothetical protein
VGTNWELDFKQCSFHHIMQVLRVYDFSVFSSPPALPPCSCSLAFRHQVRWLTSRISSESYPGDQECVANCHGAEEFTCVHHTANPAPSPPDAGRYTVPSRFGRQSGDCGYLVRGHLTARYLAAVPRRILLMEQQVWSRQLARPSTLRPRVAGRLRSRDCSRLLASELDVKVSLHPAQASQRPYERPVSSHTTCWLHDTTEKSMPSRGR